MLPTALVKFRHLFLSFFLLIVSFFVFSSAVFAETNPECTVDASVWDPASEYVKDGAPGVACNDSSDCIASRRTIIGGNEQIVCKKPVGASSGGTTKAPEILAEEIKPENYKGPQNSDNIINNLGHSLICMLEGGDNLFGYNCVQNVTAINTDTKAMISTPYLIANNPSGGALGSAFGVMIAMYDTRPATSTEYLADVGQNMGLIEPAYAQVTGSGSAVASPVLELWKVARNISYLFIIIIFIALGVMIMLKQKLNPQTAISIQNAIPRLIIGLILITFSYFIASLTLDLSFVAINMSGRVLETQGIVAPDKTSELLRKHNVLSMYNSFINFDDGIEVASTTANTLTFITRNSIVSQIARGAVSIAACKVGGSALKNVAGAGGTALGARAGTTGASILGGLSGIAGGAVGCVVGGAAAYAFADQIIYHVGGLILYLVLIIALIIAMFKLLFALVKSYITIIVLTVAAPFYFLVGAIPGRQGIVGSWFKNMIGNVLVFPAVFLAILFAAYILGYGPSVGTVVVSTPLGDIGKGDADFGIIKGAGDFAQGTVPLFGGLGTNFMKFVLAYGVLLMAPAIPAAVLKAFGAQGLGLGQEAVAGFGAGFAGGRGLANTGYEQAMKRSGLGEYLKAQKETRMRTNANAQYDAWRQRLERPGAQGQPARPTLLGRVTRLFEPS